MTMSLDFLSQFNISFLSFIFTLVWTAELMLFSKVTIHSAMDWIVPESALVLLIANFNSIKNGMSAHLYTAQEWVCVCVPVVKAAAMRAISLSLGGHEVLEGSVSGSNSVSPFQHGQSLTALAAALTQIAPPPPFFSSFFSSRWLRWVFDSCAFCTSSHCNVHLCLRAVHFCAFPFLFHSSIYFSSNPQPSFFLQHGPNHSLLSACPVHSCLGLNQKSPMPFYFLGGGGCGGGGWKGKHHCNKYMHNCYFM